MISLHHHLIGRDALEKTKDSVRRSKVMLVLDPEDGRNVLGEDRAVRRAGGRGVRRVGRAPGAWDAPFADLGFPRIRATVQPAPFGEHARTQYRRNARRHPRTTIRTM
ncbi:hypothetical protein ABZ612_13480 [Streptomyces avermitilis]|uniref:hypothetical protein n=1 Tax=Streptomyces avermitilis TaxID=33903 RepID=UPI0033EB5DD7